MTQLAGYGRGGRSGFGRDVFRVESAKPTPTDALRAAIRDAGERCKRARARGWIDEYTERLPDDKQPATVEYES